MRRRTLLWATIAAPAALVFSFANVQPTPVLRFVLQSAARWMLDAAAYAEQLAAVSNPMVLAAIGPLSQVTTTALTTLGLNVDPRANDEARRASAGQAAVD